MNFEKFIHPIPIFAAMYAVNDTSPAQLPLVSGCRNSGDKALIKVKYQFMMFFPGNKSFQSYFFYFFYLNVKLIHMLTRNNGRPSRL